MIESRGKELRLSEFINPEDNHSLILDTSIAGSLGAPLGLEDIVEGVGKVVKSLDGIILNPGQLKRLQTLFNGSGLPGTSALKGRRESPFKRIAYICRLDWTNALRKEDFVLPLKRVNHRKIASPSDALSLGSQAGVAYFLLGYDEDLEAEMVNYISMLSRECSRQSFPLIADVRPLGPKVTKANFSQVVKLSVTMLIELGVDALIIPYPGEEALRDLKPALSIPVFVRLEKDEKNILRKALNLGLQGAVLGEFLFAQKDPGEIVRKIRKVVHFIA